MTDADLAAAENAVREFEGVYAEGVWAAEFCRATDIKLFAGTGFNLFNRLSLETLAEEDAFLSAKGKTFRKHSALRAARSR